MTSAAQAGSVVGGRYALEYPIGKGGMGEVWRARHLALDSHVAIKFLGGTSASNEATTQRFLSEAQLTARLRSRNAVQVFDFGVMPSGQPYIVMELLTGETLAQRLLARGRISEQATVTLLRQASKALLRAHSFGIIHRDFKPDNIFITLDPEGVEEVKVVDFGLAKLMGTLESEPSDGDRARERATGTKESLSSFTRTEAFLGTPHYMAPEQTSQVSSELTPAVDVWAFGVVAFECLTASVPFDGGSIASLFEVIRAGRHPKATALNPKLTAAFDVWFDTACATQANKRFPSVRAAFDALVVALGQRPEMEDASAPSLPSSIPADDAGPQATVDVGSSEALMAWRSRQRQSDADSDSLARGPALRAMLESAPALPVSRPPGNASTRSRSLHGRFGMRIVVALMGALLVAALVVARGVAPSRAPANERPAALAPLTPPAEAAETKSVSPPHAEPPPALALATSARSSPSPRSPASPVLPRASRDTAPHASSAASSAARTSEPRVTSASPSHLGDAGARGRATSPSSSAAPAAVGDDMRPLDETNPWTK